MASRALRAIALSAFLVFLFVLPNVIGCDANPSLRIRFSFTKTHPHLSPLAPNSQKVSLVSRTLKITKPKRIVSWLKKNKTALNFNESYFLSVETI